MATQEQVTTEINSIVQALADLKQLAAEDLGRRAELGSETNFELAKPNIERALSLVLQFEFVPLEQLSGRALSSIRETTQQVREVLNKIKSFRIVGTERPNEIRDALANRIRDDYDEWFFRLSPILSYVRTLRGAELDKQKAEVDALRLHFIQATEQIEKKSKETGEQLDKTLRAAQDAASKVGVSTHSAIFAEEAKSHSASATYWLVALIVIAIGGGVFVGWTIVDLQTPEKLDFSQAFQLIAARLIGLSLIYAAAVTAMRNYRAHRHNYTVNRHRQNALTTFEAFVQATADQETKNAVLLRTTEAIFAPVATGYIGVETDNVGGTQVLEVIRSIAPKQSPSA